MKIFLLSLLVLLALVKNTVAQNVDWNLVEQHYFEKYQPIDTPAWIFPIISINGDGQEDTCYYCYDSSAYLYNYDEINFGEIRYKTDTGNFLSAFYAASLDSFYSVQVFGDNIGFDMGDMGIYLNNAHFPITMKWNKQKLYDTILPFPNILPNPITKIGGFWACTCTPFILGTAESFIQAEPGGSPCFNVGQFFTDSIVFDGPANANINDVLGISLSLRAQGSDCSYGAVNSIISNALISCSILSEKQIELKSNCLENLNFDIVDLYGRIIYRDKIFTKEVKHVDVHSNVNLLFVRVYNVNYYQTFKILIK